MGTFFAPAWREQLCSEILQLLAEGKSNKDAANLLNVSIYTVETHRAHILQKLGLHTVPGLILYAVRKGTIS
jgi:two-component system, NarL family, response regulator NreC